MSQYRRILVAVDGSDTSNKALVAALQLARDAGGQVRVVHFFDDLVYLTGYEYAGTVLEQAREQARQVLDAALAIAQSSGAAADCRLLDQPGVRLGDAIAQEAKDWSADLVVVGTHGRRGINRLLLGSGAEQVIRLAPCPVLVVRDRQG